MLKEIATSSNIDIENQGVNGIYLTVYQPVDMKASMKIFSILPSNKNLVLIKLNGKNSENVYRLYSNNYKSPEGLKIPVLHEY